MTDQCHDQMGENAVKVVIFAHVIFHASAIFDIFVFKFAFFSHPT